ncbi:MAG: hypothetical protein EOO41_00385 [Methanobacteriota archaeon]|nr:MAG: hypothetical protein EOO41_00385 [Euryarchaeota archaeon]
MHCRDTLCLNGATAGSLFPPALVAAVQRAITRQAAPAATALATGASSPQHPTRAGGSGGVSAGGASLFAAPDALSAMMSATTAAGGGGGGFTVTSTASSPAASPARAGSASGVTYMGFSTRPSERAALSTFRPQLTIPKLSAPGATGAGAVGGASGTPGALATPASAGTGAARMVGSRKVSDAGVGSPLVAGAKVVMQGASSPTAQPTTPNTFSSSLKGGTCLQRARSRGRTRARECKTNPWHTICDAHHSSSACRCAPCWKEGGGGCKCACPCGGAPSCKLPGCGGAQRACGVGRLQG